jgi:hypothetical protein
MYIGNKINLGKISNRNILKQYTITTALIFAFLGSLAQKAKTECDLKKLSTLFKKVEERNSKKDLDKLFSMEGLLIDDSGKSDSTAKIYKYQFCDDKIEHSIMAAFLKGNLVYILKSFPGNNFCGKEEDFQKNLSPNYSYEDIKKLFDMEGDLKMISWNRTTAIETKTEYIWRCCGKATYFSVVFENGKFKSGDWFPKKTDYSRPSNGKK